MRRLDPKLLAAFRLTPRCEHCHYPADCQVHHLTSKGLGGARRLDIHENLIALCLGCHTDFHNGRIEFSVLLKIVAQRERLTPEEVMDRIWKLRRE